MSKISSIFRKWSEMSLVLRILVGLVIGAILGLLLPGWTWVGILGTIFVSTLKAIAPVLVAVGFIIGVIQDSVETALNSSGDAFFAATAEYADQRKRNINKI